jgi:hypothetical protein
MTIAYNWVITQTDYETSNGFITTAHWTASAVDASLDGSGSADYTASIYSTCSFAPATPSIPYASVTEAEVLGWCWNNGVDKDATEAALAAQIALQKNPVTATGTPWSAAV